MYNRFNLSLFLRKKTYILSNELELMNNAKAYLYEKI